MFRYIGEKIINFSQRPVDEGKTLKLDLDKWIEVFWFGANSQAIQNYQDLNEKLSIVGAYVAYEEDLTWFWKSS